ncbi:hypothetical protein Osc7112_3752 [Oscillatoria nigro-viridis PCC 7112]|uniref:Uncharacterized protein n=1 Tax=Phormidium nigroviride PCC 7112 TaxID=179408 RepID=K9VJ43_9CYAN|nr:hypothetical protein Osc7112_3752 [Oscillatoria nigro-viridis PCC 7112]
MRGLVPPLKYSVKQSQYLFFTVLPPGLSYFKRIVVYSTRPRESFAYLIALLHLSEGFLNAVVPENPLCWDRSSVRAKFLPSDRAKFAQMGLPGVISQPILATMTEEVAEILG